MHRLAQLQTHLTHRPLSQNATAAELIPEPKPFDSIPGPWRSESDRRGTEFVRSWQAGLTRDRRRAPLQANVRLFGWPTLLYDRRAGVQVRTIGARPDVEPTQGPPWLRRRPHHHRRCRREPYSQVESPQTSAVRILSPSRCTPKIFWRKTVLMPPL